MNDDEHTRQVLLAVFKHAVGVAVGLWVLDGVRGAAVEVGPGPLRLVLAWSIAWILFGYAGRVLWWLFMDGEQ